jgi:hypothetical protein
MIVDDIQHNLRRGSDVPLVLINQNNGPDKVWNQLE